ncbi:unnamed protein product [Amoebophrya sp. A25]|nr:unnamed protein product [Amoebophrya sp. A25]|eukprot:GSA25T00000409001.1
MSGSMHSQKALSCCSLGVLMRRRTNLKILIDSMKKRKMDSCSWCTFSEEIFLSICDDLSSE